MLCLRIYTRTVTIDEEPSSLNASINQEVHLNCSAYNAEFIRWWLCPSPTENFPTAMHCVETKTLDSYIDDVYSQTSNLSHSTLILNILDTSTTLTQLNDSYHYCVAVNLSAQRHAASSPARLLLQGI